MRMDRHLIRVLTEVLDRISCSQVPLKAQHHELLRKGVKSDILREESLQCSIHKALSPSGEDDFLSQPASDSLLDFLHARSLRGPV